MIILFVIHKKKFGKEYFNIILIFGTDEIQVLMVDSILVFDSLLYFADYFIK